MLYLCISIFFERHGDRDLQTAVHYPNVGNSLSQARWNSGAIISKQVSHLGGKGPKYLSYHLFPPQKWKQAGTGCRAGTQTQAL